MNLMNRQKKIIITNYNLFFFFHLIAVFLEDGKTNQERKQTKRQMRRERNHLMKSNLLKLYYCFIHFYYLFPFLMFML